MDKIKDLGERKLAAMLGEECNEILASAGYSIAVSDQNTGTGGQPLGEVSLATVNAQGTKRTREAVVDVDAERWKRPRTKLEIIDLEDDE